MTPKFAERREEERRRGIVLKIQLKERRKKEVKKIKEQKRKVSKREEGKIVDNFCFVFLFYLMKHRFGSGAEGGNPINQTDFKFTVL